MTLYNNYILTVATYLLLANAVITAGARQTLDFYYTIYVIGTLITTELYVYLHPKAKKGLSLVSYILFAGFIVIVIQKVIEILT
ncbi:MAG: hypothetical protein DDT42_01176 [candidate division WS2 bacterium]|uniref:Uncharacterized protein n=1 Tax=Psychracetigena formicireducens TaxID=2986056 RepID=A0A9E2BGS6_PSYF1|nr:hypothetical protein [Candidatus Psychracetigena formicireducens]MBT9145306.1 hypothetical protein [Candidatus Psychracetigena formicireducens]